jgi:hypothetical protein
MGRCINVPNPDWPRNVTEATSKGQRLRFCRDANMSTLRRLFALAAVGFVATYWPGATNAQSITWQLKNVFFAPENGGGEWTGSFVFDATTGSITEWSISVPGGVVFPQTIPPYTYTSFSPTASASYQLDAQNAVIQFGTTTPPCNSSQTQRCLLIQSPPLPKGGGTVVLSGDHPSEEVFTPEPFNSFIRTIDFTKNPQLIGVAPFIATPSVLWPPNNKLVPVTVTVSQVGLSNCQIKSVSSNEMITTSDWRITGDLNVELRAFRSGKGNGRVYTIEIGCMNTSGNPVTGNVTVTVPLRAPGSTG